MNGNRWVFFFKYQGHGKEEEDFTFYFELLLSFAN